MAQDAGTIYAEIRVRLDQLSSDLEQVQTMFKKTGKGIDESVGQKAKSMSGLKETITAVSTAFLAVKGAAGIVMGAFRQLSNILGNLSRQYIAQAQETAKLNALVESTGAIAWTTSSQLEEMADQLSRTTRFAQRDIMAAQSALLGFRNITGEMYERTLQLLMDHTTVMGGNLTSTAKNFGRALEDPVQGMRLLNRQGYAFRKEDEQLILQMIESEGIFAARSHLLSILESNYAGAAEAVANASEAFTALQRAQNASEDLALAVGRQTGGLTALFHNLRASFSETWALFFELRQEARDMPEEVQRLDAALSDQYTTINDVRANTAKLRNEMNALRNTFMQVQGASDWTSELEMELLASSEEASNLNDRLIGAEGTLDRARVRAQQLKVELLEAQLALSRATLGLQIIVSDAELAGQQTIIDNLQEQRSLLREMQNEQAIIVATREDENRLISNVEVQMQAIVEIEQDRARAVDETNELYRRGAIDADQRNSRIAAVFTREATQLNQIFVKYRQSAAALSVTEEGRLRIQRRTNEALEEAIRLQHIWNDAANNQLMTAEQAIAERTAILEEYERRRAHLFAMQDTMQQDELEFNRELLQLYRWRTDSLDDLIFRARAFRDLEAWPQTLAALQTAREQEVIQENKVARLLEERGLQEEIERLQERRATLGMHELMIGERKIAQEQARINEMIAADRLSQQVGQNYLEALEEWHRASRNFMAHNAMAEYQRRVQEMSLTARQLLQKERQEVLRNAEVYRGAAGFDGLINAINEYYDLLERRSSWQTFFGNARSYLNKIQQLFSAISDWIMARARNNLHDTIRMLEERHHAIVEALDKELQARLFAEGLATANTREQIDANLRNAIVSGDHRTMFEAEQAKKRFIIEQDIAERRADADEELRAARAQAEFNYAMKQWRLQKLQAKASIAQAIVVAMASSPWPINLIPIGFATATGAFQLATIHAAQPRLQAFRDGGIVAGDPFRGDATPIIAKGREMMLTMEDQAGLLNMIRGSGTSEASVLNLVIELDGEVLAESVFDIGSRGNQFIRARAVVR